MGPQLVRCGKQGLDQSRLLLLYPFNGAATCSLRKEPSKIKLDWDSPAFNGAATCSLRKVFNRSLSTFATANLQWGRNLFVAERRSTVWARTGTCVTFNGAATCSLRKDKYVFKVDQNTSYLQWGRNLFVAESSVYVDLMQKTLRLLQWGRNLFVAESGPNWGDTGSNNGPSMGPQLVRCGKARA